jgi:prepilin-type N-terminal cleavage/methylation domain-containing protein/prepilin-type processing-associated H-X9-DG protein
MMGCFGKSTRGVDARAFSLVELLVVIAIVAVVIALTLPAILGVRERGRTAVCLSNSRQITIAIGSFAASNKGMLPNNRVNVRPGEHVTWRKRMNDDGYLAPGKGWVCPAQPGIGPKGEEGLRVDNDSLCVGDQASSYALNGHVLWRGEFPVTGADRSDTAIVRPEHTFLLVESAGPWPDMRVINELIASGAEQGSGGAYSYWHAGLGTYAFLDGHCQNIKMFDTGNPDCRWHNGRDYTLDPDVPQAPEELQQHAHPDWQYLLSRVYLGS